MSCLIIVLWIILITSLVQLVSPAISQRLTEQFSGHHVVWPRVKHVSKQQHVDDPALELEVKVEVSKDHEIILDLKLNTGLLNKGYFVKHDVNGTQNIHKPKNLKETELCHYHGKIRGMDDSWAAIAACQGVRGMIYDGEVLLVIEPDDSTTANRHLLFKHQYHLITNNSSPQYGAQDIVEINSRPLNRRRRGVIVTSQNSEHNPLYVEMLLVVDHATFVTLGADQRKVARRCMNMINVLNALMSPLNVLVALVGVVMWSSEDKIPDPSTERRHEFLEYRKLHINQQHPNDHAQLLVVKGNLQGVTNFRGICDNKQSGAVVQIIRDVDAYTAITMAHELGHSLGMLHDSDYKDCQCPDPLCIMHGISNYKKVLWSSCSFAALAESLKSKITNCLKNVPEKLFSSPDCGNGFLEAGEECDCGPVDFCSTPCCDPRTCRLQENATCGTGPCCNTRTCQLRKPGSTCRVVTNECDLPEFCTGLSEICPRDLTKQDGEPCHQNQMCVLNKCVPVPRNSVQLVTNCSMLQCHGHGVCNNLGKCHCDVGFAPPDCTSPGLGGSKDSGPASSPNENAGLIGWLIFFAATLLMSFLITLFVCVIRYQNNKTQKCFASTTPANKSSVKTRQRLSPAVVCGEIISETPPRVQRHTQKHPRPQQPPPLPPGMQQPLLSPLKKLVNGKEIAPIFQQKLKNETKQSNSSSNVKNVTKLVEMYESSQLQCFKPKVVVNV